ncbi:hypothetical protein D3C72_2181560 [compost metagenome]
MMTRWARRICSSICASPKDRLPSAAAPCSLPRVSASGFFAIGAGLATVAAARPMPAVAVCGGCATMKKRFEALAR